MPSAAEAGVRRTEYFFCRETLDDRARPQTPTDPAWLMYSSTVDSDEQSSSANWEERTGIGVVDPTDKNRNQESHELTVSYDLERFPVDADGNPQDAFADAALRTIDNTLLNTHSFLERELKQNLVKSNTLHAKYFAQDGNTHPGGNTEATRKDTRLIHYGRGGVPDEPEMSVDPGDDAVIGIELPYQFHKIRPYQIDQPASSVTLYVRSTDSNDTGKTVDLESADGSTTENLSLDSADATTPVTTTASFASLRAANVDGSDMTGTIEVYADDGTGAPGQLLTVVHGSATYDGIEGDSGVPLLGAGSFDDGANLGDPQVALGRQLDWQGDPAAEKIMSTTLTITNNIEDTNTQTGLAKDLRTAARGVSLTSTVFGETETYDKLSQHLEGLEGKVILRMQGGDMVIPRGYIESGGGATKEANQAYLSTEVTFSALQPSDGGAAIQFVPA